jgi:hypothetical protein
MAKDDDDIPEVPEPLPVAISRFSMRLQSQDLALKLISRGLQDGRFQGFQNLEPLPRSYWQQVRLGIELVDLSPCPVVIKDGIEEKGMFQICKGQPASFEQKPLPEPASPQQELIQMLVKEKYPNGAWYYAGTGDIMKSVGDKIKDMGLKIPDRNVFLRALGRRD